MEMAEGLPPYHQYKPNKVSSALSIVVIEQTAEQRNAITGTADDPYEWRSSVEGCIQLVV